MKLKRATCRKVIAGAGNVPKSRPPNFDRAKSDLRPKKTVFSPSLVLFASRVTPLGPSSEKKKTIARTKTASSFPGRLLLLLRFRGEPIFSPTRRPKMQFAALIRTNGPTVGIFSRKTSTDGGQRTGTFPTISTGSSASISQKTLVYVLFLDEYLIRRLNSRRKCRGLFRNGREFLVAADLNENDQ